MATTTKKAASADVATHVTRPTGYDTDLTYYATRYKQGGRTVYSVDWSPKQVISTIKRPDPDAENPGNRKIRPQHAVDFANYFRQNDNWVIPNLILRVSKYFTFDPITEVDGTEFGIITIPRRAIDDIHILDGQHRCLGMFIADERIAQDIDKAQQLLSAARRQRTSTKEFEARLKSLEHQRARLDSERVSLQIFVEPDPIAFRQMFFDIADNALGITASVRTRFDNRKVVNRSIESVLEHPLLRGRVDQNYDRVSGKSPYILAVKHVSEITKASTVGFSGRVSLRQEQELKEAAVASRAKGYFDLLVNAFPQFQSLMTGSISPETLRKTSLLGSVMMMRILAGVRWELVANHGFNDALVLAFFEKLAPHMTAPVHENSVWITQIKEEGAFFPGSVSPGSRRQDSVNVLNAIVEWAILKPEWLDQAPLPAPDDTELDLDELDEEQADAILRPETARARRERAEKQE